MGTTIAFYKSPGRTLFFIVISINLARYGIMPFQTNFKISPGMPSNPTDLFLLIIGNPFLIMIIVMVKSLRDYFD